MSEILKSEAVVLSRIKYGDSSLIASLFTKEFGKMSAIVKGGRNPKSKIGSLIDAGNHLQIIFYKKSSRELQLISSADLISHFPNLKMSIEGIKYANAILELIQKLVPEHDTNTKLFNGVVRIFSLIDESKEPAIVLFARFFMFFLSEIGYQIQLNNCAGCGKKLISQSELYCSFDLGIFCRDCKSSFVESYIINAELFRTLLCLKNGAQLEEKELIYVEKAVAFMEKYLKHHVSDFNGIQSLIIFNNKEIK